MASISSWSIMDDYSTIGFGRTKVGVLNSYLQFPAVGDNNRKTNSNVSCRGWEHTDFSSCISMFPGIQQPILPKEQISSLIPIVHATKPFPLVSRARKLARKYKWLISEIFRLDPLIFGALSPCFLCTCMWIHGCKYLGTHACGNQSRMVAAVLLPSTLLPWDRVPRWKGSPLDRPGCLVGHLALRSAWLYPSSNLGGFSNLEIWTWALTLAEWVFLLTQPPHQLSVFFFYVIFLL